MIFTLTIIFTFFANLFYKIGYSKKEKELIQNNNKLQKKFAKDKVVSIAQLQNNLKNGKF